MKIGINLVGVSYNSGNEGRYRNYKDSLHSFQSKIVEPLKDKGYEIYFYLFTYDSEKKLDILKSYQPVKKFKFLDKEFNKKGGGDQSSSNMKMISYSYIQSLERIKDEELDLIISTRFDIDFNVNLFEEFDFDFSKCNFLWREPEYTDLPIVSDTFIVFPGNMTQNLINAINTMETTPPQGVNVAMHNIYLPMCDEVGKENVKIVCDDFHRSHTNPYFKLTRK